ncbi:MAG: hypothetical protein ACI35W_07155 [Anaeroplasmataceae bacterium]
MKEFAKYYTEFLKTIFKNIGKFFKTIGRAFKNAFYTDIKGYISDLKDASIHNQYWNWSDWVAYIIVLFINIAFVVLLVTLIVVLFKRYFRFRRREIEKDELVDQVQLLNKKVIDLVDEKNKILALRVSQISGGDTDINPDDLFNPQGKPEDDEEEEIFQGRFIKLNQVDTYYKSNPEYTIMSSDDMLDLPGLIDRFIGYAASQLKLYYSKEIIARFFGGMGATKVLILEGISGTGKTSLPYAMGKFFNKPTSIISVQPSWRDRAELLGYLNEFTKRFNETDFLRSVYMAGYSDKPNFIVLDEMNLARIEYYFAEFLSVMEMPDPTQWLIDLVPGTDPLDPKLLINGKLLINQNIWFVGTANKDDSTFTITDKVYDRALPIVINHKAELVDAPYTENVQMSFEYLDELFKQAQRDIQLSTRVMENFAKLDEFIQEKFKIAFGNRIMKQIKLFVPVYIACGMTEIQGLDYMLCNKILRKFESLNLSFLRNELDQLITLLDKLFGKNAFKVSIDFINDLKKVS